MNARQHTSHRELLTPFATGAAHASLDAIIVPNGRPAGYLLQAIEAARRLDAHLVLLCSLRADAALAAQRAKRGGVAVTAIDVTQLPRSVVPEFATDRLLLRNDLHRMVDTSLKRNLGLLLARLAGWKRILFLDDDIVLPDPADLTTAAGLIDGDYAVVGLANGGMPDNSVVCHALRAIGEAQDTFIGGGALVVGKPAFDSFFPNIYNEDWFFLLDGEKMRPSAVTGLAIQHPYDPFRNTWRARGEELGDTLAEGLFGLLDSGDGLAAADEDYWKVFLPDRRRIISGTIARVENSDIETGPRSRMVAALKAAIGRSHLITPDLCVRYIRAWQRDRISWCHHVQELDIRHRNGQGIGKALATLGINHLAESGLTTRAKRRSGSTRTGARG
ncbi:hypothetical protein [Amycolatopsis sp. CA-128772]|uniref:hypothetical protein n=1 Tax=Amycolatopsis sp. CA-128772 TaxID=2073159 RepID=UPI0011B06751|nr:hypothetical protein [Amycolatopsis sp. CA-128772]